VLVGGDALAALADLAGRAGDVLAGIFAALALAVRRVALLTLRTLHALALGLRRWRGRRRRLVSGLALPGLGVASVRALLARARIGRTLELLLARVERAGAHAPARHELLLELRRLGGDVRAGLETLLLVGGEVGGVGVRLHRPEVVVLGDVDLHLGEGRRRPEEREDGRHSGREQELAHGDLLGHGSHVMASCYGDRRSTRRRFRRRSGVAAERRGPTNTSPSPKSCDRRGHSVADRREAEAEAGRSEAPAGKQVAQVEPEARGAPSGQAWPMASPWLTGSPSPAGSPSWAAPHSLAAQAGSPQAASVRAASCGR